MVIGWLVAELFVVHSSVFRGFEREMYRRVPGSLYWLLRI